ncbi:hypothetical protein Cni_G27771 [Canna indica]|uniref:K-box domain-containing protein n=1 Tax=Canna indica TaxID=4628 RepID=A0AAQ3QPM8_9LILI|nr:hypothetical protein Cni_G27771 [Canna indica]
MVSLASPALPASTPRFRCCEDTLGRRRHCPPPPSPLAADAQFPERLLAVPCPRPRRIILVRHGQSEGNVDESAYTRVPDPKIGLTPKGWRDAEVCGLRIRDLVAGDDGADDWKVYFYVSPYCRTLETLRGLGKAFDRSRIAGVREEPRLREQDFGNFQDREKMRIEKEIRRRYGRFFYRFPNGESAADVYDRITGFRETLKADIDIGRFQPPGERSPNMNLVIVSHGLTLRVFLMRWYKWTVEQFEGLSNFDNGGMLVMQTGSGGRYSLLVHHTVEELRAFGLTEAMLNDQMWQKTAKIGHLSYGTVLNLLLFLSSLVRNAFIVPALSWLVLLNAPCSSCVAMGALELTIVSSSRSVEKTIGRYMKHSTKEVVTHNQSTECGMQQWKSEATSILEKLELIEAQKRKLLGEHLGSCSLQELNELEDQLERSLSNIKEKRWRMLSEQITQLKEKERVLLQENAVLRDRCNSVPLLKLNVVRDDHAAEDNIEEFKVETELMIGRPGSR